MSKPSLGSLVVPKGSAAPAAIETPRKEETKEPRKEAVIERRRPWDGQDDIVKANYEVPRRVQTKLHTLKTWGRVKNIKGFVSEALERALDKEIAAAEKEGF
jgi:hypothetical protein